jgi:hypothetical protein
MTRLRPTLAAALAALLLAAPAAAAARLPHMTPVELARAQERAYMQQANPVRDMTAVELPLAQERAFMQQANARRMPARTATATPGGPSTALVAGSIAAGLLLAATGGVAAIAVRRRHMRGSARLVAGPIIGQRSKP